MRWISAGRRVTRNLIWSETVPWREIGGDVLAVKEFPDSERAIFQTASLGYGYRLETARIFYFFGTSIRTQHFPNSSISQTLLNACPSYRPTAFARGGRPGSGAPKLMATSCFGRGTARTPCTHVRSAAGAGAWRASVHARPRARSLAAAAGDVGGLKRKTRVHRPVDTMFGLCSELFMYFRSRSSSFNEYFRQALRTARTGPEETCRRYSFLNSKIQTRAQSTIAPSAAGPRHGRSE